MKTIKIIFINLFILGIILLVVDPFLAVEITDQKTYRNLELREYGPDRSLVLTPNAHSIDTSLLDSKTYVLETNHSGFIIGPEQDPSEKCELLFFGGSTTECAYVDDSLRFPYVVGKKLGIVSGASGYGGNHSFHSFINLVGAGIEEKPKTVVWMHAINDFSLLCKTGSYFTSPANRLILNENKRLAQPTFGQRWKKVGSSIMMAAIPNLYMRIKRVGASSQGATDEWAGYRDLGAVPDSIIQQKFKASLLSFVQTARAHDMQVVLMTQFNRISLKNSEIMQSLGGGNGYTDEAFTALYRSLNQIIREVAQSENVQLIDLAQQVPDSPDYFYDAVHLNNAGSKLVSEIVSDSLMSFLKKVDQTSLETIQP